MARTMPKTAAEYEKYKREREQEGRSITSPNATPYGAPEQAERKKTTYKAGTMPKTMDEYRQYRQNRQQTQQKELEWQKWQDRFDLRHQRDELTRTGGSDADWNSYYVNQAQYGRKYGDQRAYTEAMNRTGEYYNRKLAEMNAADQRYIPAMSQERAAKLSAENAGRRYAEQAPVYEQMARDAAALGDKNLFDRAQGGYNDLSGKYGNAYAAYVKAMNDDYKQRMGDLEKSDKGRYLYQTTSKEDVDRRVKDLQTRQEELKTQMEEADLERRSMRNNPDLIWYDTSERFEDNEAYREYDRVSGLYGELQAEEERLEQELAQYQRAKDLYAYDDYLALREQLSPGGGMTQNEWQRLRAEGERKYRANQAAAEKEKAEAVHDVYSSGSTTTGPSLFDLVKLRSDMPDIEDQNGLIYDKENGWHLTKEDSDMFYILYAQDPEKAAEFIHTAKLQRDDEFQQYIADHIKDNPYLRLTAGMQGGAVAHLIGGAANLLDPYSETALEINRVGNALSMGAAQGAEEHGIFNTGALAGKIDENIPVIGDILGGKGLGDAYQLGTSMVESGLTAAAAAAVGDYGDAVVKVVEFLGTAIMGSSAAASDYDECIKRGLDRQQAMVHATSAGIAEAAFEYISLDKLVNQNITRGLAKNFFLQGGIEASEEACTTIANRITDAILARQMGYDSSIEQRVKELMALGVDRKEAEDKAEQEWLTEVINDAIGGFISGGFMTLGKTAMNWREYKAAREQNRKAGATARRSGQTKALEQYAQDNDLGWYGEKFDEGAPVIDLTEEDLFAGGDKSPAELTKQTRQEKRQERQAQREQKRQLREQAKQDRQIGSDAQRVQAHIQEQFAGKSIQEQTQLRDQMIRQYGNGIAPAVYEAVTVEAAKKAASLKSADEIRAARDQAVNETQDRAMKRAIEDGYDQAVFGQAMRSGNADEAGRYFQQLRNTGEGGMTLEATVKDQDGQSRQIAITGMTEDGKGVKLADGTTVAVSKLQADADTMDAVQRIAELEMGADADAVLQAYIKADKSGVDGYRWLMDYSLAYEQGRTNKLSLDEAVKRSSLDQRTVMDAYTRGQREAHQSTREAVETVKAMPKKEGITGKTSNIDTSEIEGITLNESEREQFEFANKVFSLIGVDVKWVASAVKNGRYVGANGSYLNGVVTLDVHAGRNFLDQVNSGVLATMGHELTHFLQQYAPEQYRALKEFLFRQIVQSSANGETRLERLIWEKQRRASSKLSRKAAEDEVVADACQTMLRDSKAIREFAQQDEETAKGIARWLDKWFGKLKQAFSRSAQLTEEARFVDGLAKEVREAFGKLWDEALREAVETHDRVGNMKNPATEGGEQYSVRPNIDTDLQNIEARNYNFNTELLIGTTSDFLVNKIGFKPLPNYMSATKAYRSMVTEEQAIKDGQPTGPNIHYHGLGVNGLHQVLEKSENPVVAYVSAPDDFDGRRTRLVLVTDYAINDGTGVTVVEPDLTATPGRGRVRANKDITVFSKEDVRRAVIYAAKENRLLYLDKNRGSIFNSGEPGTNNPVAISEDVLNNNIAKFWADVKWRDYKKTAISAGDNSPNTPMAEALKNWNPHSDRDYDNTGRELSEGQKEYFKDSAIRDSKGNLMVLYHGTKADFNIFDTIGQGGKNGTQEGFGIYLTNEKKVSDAYGDRVIEGYANIKRPATSWKKTIKRTELARLIKESCMQEARRMVDDGEYDSVKEALFDTWISNYVLTYESPTMEANYRKAADTILGANDNDMEIVQEVMIGMGIRSYKAATDFYHNVLTPTTGIDGFWTRWRAKGQGQDADVILAFDSNQVKNASNKTPTSNPDIRYSERDYDLPSDLELMDRAIEGLSEPGGEEYWKALLESDPGLAEDVKDYKDQARKLAAAEKRLADYKKQMQLGGNRKLNTRGITSLSLEMMKVLGASDAKGRGVAKKVVQALTDAYQKALDSIDKGMDDSSAFEIVYNEGVVPASEIIAKQGTHSEKTGRGWITTSLESYYGEGGLQSIIDTVAGYVGADYALNRYRKAIQPTVADRIVERTEKRMQKQVDAATERATEAERINKKLTEDRDFWKNQQAKDSETVTFLNERLKEARQDLRDNKSLSSQERRKLDARIKSLQTQLQAKREEIRALKSLSQQLDKQAVEFGQKQAKLLDKLEQQVQRERDILAGKLKPLGMQRLLKAEREKAAATAKQHKEEVFQNYKERKNQTAIRNRIKNLHDEMSRDLLKPREGHFVPQTLIRPVVDLLDMVNTTQDQTLARRLEALEQKIQNAKTDEQRQALEDQKTGLLERIGKLDAKVASINAAYDAIKKDERYSQYYDETVKDMLVELGQTLAGRSIYELNSDELADVYTVMKAMRTTIRNTIKADLVEKGKEAWEIGNQLRQELRNGKGASPILLEKYHMAMLSAKRAFNRFGGYLPDSTWNKVYQMLDKAQLKMLNIDMQATRIFDPVMSGKENLKKAAALNSYKEKDLVDVGLKDADGNAVKITRGMMLALYMHLQNEENMRHAMYGGLTLPDYKRYYNGSSEAWGRGTVEIPALGAKVSNLEALLEEQGEAWVDEKYKEYEAEIRETFESIRQNIENELTDYDRQWIECAKEFFDDFSRRELNAVTNSMYGFSKAKVDNYFPIVTDKNFLKSEFDSVSRNISLENAGFMKERVKASNPILLEDLTRTIIRQKDNVSRYAGLTEALKTFGNVYNTQTKGFTDSVKKAMAKTYGKNGQQYIENLITDMIGGRTTPGSLFDKIKGNYAQAVLSANLSVTIKQAASLPTAAATVGWGPIMKALARGGRRNMPISRADTELINTYTPLLYYRSKGSIDTEIGELPHAKDWTKKAKWLMGWIQGVDKATVGRLWYAAEYYVKDHYDLEKGTAEQIKNGESPFYQKVAEVFRDIVEDTQPNYTVLQRPDILRNPNKLVRAMTMFSTQRFQNANILIDSVNEYAAMVRYDKKNGTQESKAARKAAKTKLTNAISSQVVSAVVLSAMTLFANMVMHRMNPWRDDDDELTQASIMEEFLDSFLSTMAGSFLGGSELYEAISSILTGSKYYGNDVGGISTINDFATAVVNFGQKAVKLIGDEESKPEDWTKLAETQLAKVGEYLAQMTGVPIANINKIISGGKNHIIDAINGEFFSFEAGVERTDKANARRLIGALESGDTAKANDVLKDLSDPDKRSRAVTAYLKELFLKDEISEAKTITYLTQFVQTSEDGKKRPITEDEAYWKIREWEAIQDHKGEEGYKWSQYEDLRVIMDSKGDISSEVQHLTDHGVKDTSVNNEVKDYIKKLYTTGKITEDEAMSMLQKYHQTKDDKTKQYRADTADEAWFIVDEWKEGAESDEEDFNYTKYSDLREAIRTSGNVKDEINLLTGHGVTEKAVYDDVNDTIKAMLSEGSINSDKAEAMLRKYGKVKDPDTKAYRAYTEDEAWKKVQEWKAKAEHAGDEDYSWGQYDAIDEALAGNKEVKGLISELTAHGVKEDSITKHIKDQLIQRYEDKAVTESQFRNQLSRYCGIVAKKDVDEIVNNANCFRDSGFHYSELKTAYNAKELSGDKARQMLVKYGGLSKDEAKQKTRFWDFEVQHPDANLSIEKVNAYYDTRPANYGKTMEQAGISVQSYISYCQQASKAQGTDLNHDGWTDSGSKKAAVMQIINGLNLTRSQKDALYYLNGWSAKTINEAPWH